MPRRKHTWVYARSDECNSDSVVLYLRQPARFGIIYFLLQGSKYAKMLTDILLTESGGCFVFSVFGVGSEEGIGGSGEELRVIFKLAGR